MLVCIDGVIYLHIPPISPRRTAHYARGAARTQSRPPEAVLSSAWCVTDASNKGGRCSECQCVRASLKAPRGCPAVLELEFSFIANLPQILGMLHQRLGNRADGPGLTGIGRGMYSTFLEVALRTCLPLAYPCVSQSPHPALAVLHTAQCAQRVL